MDAFLSLGLQHDICKAIADLGFEQPTEIQNQAIPYLLQNDGDLVGLAQTGTGKTAAFGLPLLELLQPGDLPFALILAPTRELCLQITSELKLFSKQMRNVRISAVYGGSSVSKQRKELESGVDIIVATPGRLLDFIRRGVARLEQLRVIVLDEADEMLQMGFIDDIRTILSEAPKERKTWLFSATMPEAISRLTKDFMQNPHVVQVGKRNQGAQNVEHAYFLVRNEQRFQALRRLLDWAGSPYGIVFCNTKRETQEVADELLRNNYTAAALHGDLSQQQRDVVMKAFRNKLVNILVATDVAARGIDVDDVTHVIHYGLPNEPESYTHRSGRTGRAGKHGVSWIISGSKQAVKIPQLQKQIGKTIHKKSFPTAQEVCKNQLGAFATRVASTQADVQAVRPYLEDLLPLFEGMNKEDVVSYFLAEEFDSLFKHYAQATDLNVVTEQNPRNEYRYSINLGEVDGFTWPVMKDWLRETAGLKKYAVEGVEVFKTKSEFSIVADEEKKLTEALDDLKWGKVRVKLQRIAKSTSHKSHKGGKNARPPRQRQRNKKRR
jgi:ATP-dependent RNA helicase DeaD